MPVNILRDGEVVETVDSENDAVAWIHRHHSFSVDHALAHEGYAFEEAADEPPDRAEDEALVDTLRVRTPKGIARCNLIHAGFSEASAERLVATGRAAWYPNEGDPDNRDVDNLNLPSAQEA